MLKNSLIVTGIGTDVGKTVVAAILVRLFRAEYWKPIECGGSDTEMIRSLASRSCIHPPRYALKKSCSPHLASLEEKRVIEPRQLIPPKTKRPLIIETAGGILVPLSFKILTIDLYKEWPCHWIVVTRPYVGSINHTLLTLEVLKQKGVSPLALIFNGKNRSTEEAILAFSPIPSFGPLYEEPKINSKTIQKYATLWKRSPLYTKIEAMFGTPLPQL